MEIQTNGHLGYVKEGSDVITFQVGPKATAGEIDMEQFSNIPLPMVLNVDGYKVLIMGKKNTLPEETELVIGGNRILPELLDKRVRLLYGEGPHVYKEKKEGKKVTREWEGEATIEAWLNSWQEAGLSDSADEVALKYIIDYYYQENFFTRWRYRRSRRINGTLPVAGLEHIPIKKCRLASSKDINIFSDYYEDKDFNYVLVGNWLTGSEKKFLVYNRFDPSDPLAHESCVSIHKNPAFGKIYGQNKFYEGVKEWLVGMNKTPRFINSFLENALSAKVHVIIPNAWVESKRRMLQKYCDQNKELETDGKDLIKVNGIDVGTEFYEHTLTKFIAGEVKKLSKFLSGADNQGKLYSSLSFKTSDKVEERWQIEPIDLKYKEYISALTEYDKRGDEVVVSALGMDASISNISKDGVISKSGSDLYYNYIIYLNNLTIPEGICMQPFNQALRINFPNLYKAGYRIGLYRNIPSKQEEVAPNDRLDKQD
ncbi:hypothetical protein [Carboxylicivirga marina]|uniref:hypothetical protein n=1 Tax=Carboxylicivirga marina TaxID=2800988 RepID=UPI0025945586|nr:hypothetical protein [uncultured Carboxylicivirga sp.]